MYNIDNPIENIGEVNVTLDESVLEISPSMMRFYFIFLFILVVAVVVSLLKQVKSFDDIEIPISQRGELLCNLLLFCLVYACSWLPVLSLGILDGELETASISEGFKGQLANSHCALQDVLERSFCMIIVVLPAIAFRYRNVKDSDTCCLGRPSMFMWGLFLPVVITETTRILMFRREWVMPTMSIIRHLGPLQISLKSTPVFCAQQIDEDWLRHLAVEWLETIMMVVATSFCLIPCFRYQKEDFESADSESLGSPPGYESKISQTENLMKTDLEPSKNSNENQVVASECEDDNIPSQKIPLEEDSKIDSLYAKGSGFLESIVIIGILWSIAVRPFMAIALYAVNDGFQTYSNYLPIPTHVLLIIATAVLPLELISNYKSNDNTSKTEELEKEIDSIPLWDSDDNKTHKRDVDPIWRVENEKTGENVKKTDR